MPEPLPVTPPAAAPGAGKRFDRATRDGVRAAIRLLQSGDPAAAWRAALPFAEQGDHEAQRLLGNVLSSGALGHRDFPAARAWWERAARSGDAAAQFNLGLSYGDPDAGDNDPKLAGFWMAEAVRGGHADAMVQLGVSMIGNTRGDVAFVVEGYAWLRVAIFARAHGAREVLERALKAAGWDAPARLDWLRAQALRCTAPYTGTIGPDLLRQADRDEELAYFITHQLCYIGGEQGLRQNAYAANPDAPSPLTLPGMTRKVNDLLAERSDTLPPDLMAWTLCRRGLSYGSEAVVSLSPARLWDVARPGDAVELSDGVNSHVTFVWSVDRTAGLIRFIDVWPADFLLLAGHNALGIEARVEPYGSTRQLLCITRDDFLQSVRGVVGLVGTASVDALWEGAPELHTDAVAALALAGGMAGVPDAPTTARGLGWLMSLLRGEGPVLPPERVGAAADRAWLAAARLHRLLPDEPVRSVARAVDEAAAKPGALMDELARRWPPRFESLGPRALFDEVVARAASQGGVPPAAVDPLLRPDVIGAETLLRFALRRYPDNERLRLLRAEWRIAQGEAAMAAQELAEVVDVLEAKRQDPGPLVRDLDGMETGIGSERANFAQAQVHALSLRARALCRMERFHEAVDALQRALELGGRTDAALVAQLERAANLAKLHDAGGGPPRSPG